MSSHPFSVEDGSDILVFFSFFAAVFSVLVSLLVRRGREQLEWPALLPRQQRWERVGVREGEAED